MTTLTQSDYTRRYRERQKAKTAALQSETERLQLAIDLQRAQVQSLEKTLTHAYRYIDVLDASLEKALGRPHRTEDLLFDIPESTFVKFLKAR